MKHLIALALLALSLAAQATTTTIRVLYVYNSAAASVMQAEWGSSGDPNTVFKVDAKLMTEAYQGSGIDVNFVVAGIVSSTCCGSATNTDQAAAYAASDYAIMAQRDATNADITIVVGEYPTPANVAGTANGNCASATTAVAAVNARALAQNVIAHEVGHILCATHARAVNRKTGSTPTDCKVTTSMMVNPIDKAFPTYTWRVEEGAILAFSGPNAGQMVFGEGISANAANAAMAANCPQGNHGTISYTCAATGCTVDPGGDSAHCTHTEVVHDSWDDTTFSGPAPTGAQRTTGYFQCANVDAANLFEGPSVTYGGAPLGDVDHDNVSAIIAKLLEASGWHATKIAPTLTH